MAPGIDLRGHHGYLNAPGSIKPDVFDVRGELLKKSGVYRIIRDLPIAPLPQQFVDELKRPKGTARAKLASIETKYEDDWSIAEAVKLLKSSTDIGLGQRHDDMIVKAHEVFDYEGGI